MPAWVMPPRCWLLPLECSLAVTPMKHMKPRAWAKRRKSPTSATIVTALKKPMPRKICKATTWAIRGLCSAQVRSSCSRRLTRS